MNTCSFNTQFDFNFFPFLEALLLISVFICAIIAHDLQEQELRVKSVSSDVLYQQNLPVMLITSK